MLARRAINDARVLRPRPAGHLPGDRVRRRAAFGVVVVERAGMGRAFTRWSAPVLPVLGRLLVLLVAAIVASLLVSLVKSEPIVTLSPVLGAAGEHRADQPVAVVAAGATGRDTTPRTGSTSTTRCTPGPGRRDRPPLTRLPGPVPWQAGRDEHRRPVRHRPVTEDEPGSGPRPDAARGGADAPAQPGRVSSARPSS
ncbi:hypothetical protein HBB16_18655 [Pseudonocardia sp. MCCB 268]|nr:hypothetical protein [Pseudonocardia cytotoxica]